jgi:hypothetical protein
MEEDILRLFNRLKTSSQTFGSFVQIYKTMDFSRIHLACLDSSTRETFMNDLYKHTLALIDPPTESVLYLLASLYFTQPTNWPIVPIKVTIPQYRKLSHLNHPDAKACFSKLVNEHAFMIIMHHDPHDSRIRRSDALKWIRLQNIPQIVKDSELPSIQDYLIAVGQTNDEFLRQKLLSLPLDAGITLTDDTSASLSLNPYQMLEKADSNIQCAVLGKKRKHADLTQILTSSFPESTSQMAPESPLTADSYLSISSIFSNTDLVGFPILDEDAQYLFRDESDEY